MSLVRPTVVPQSLIPHPRTGGWILIVSPQAFIETPGTRPGADCRCRPGGAAARAQGVAERRKDTLGIVFLVIAAGCEFSMFIWALFFGHGVFF